MKKQLFNLFALVGFLTLQISVQAQTWAWKNQLQTSTSASNEVYNDVAVDGWGNTYAVGYFTGNILINGATISAKDSNDILVTKTNKNGQLIWVKSFGARGNDVANGVTLDERGNPYITGYYWGKIQFGNTTLDSVNTTKKAFVAKLDSAGNAIWGTKIISVRNNSGIGIEYSKKSGLLIVAGKIRGAVGFDGGINLTGFDNDNIYIGKIDTLGAWKNATKIAANANLAFGGMAIDNNDNVFVSFTTYITNTTPINAYKADGTTVSSNLITGLNITPQTGGLVFLTRISADFTTSSRWAYQSYQTGVYNNGVAVGPDNNPVFIFSYKAYQGQVAYQVRKLSNDFTNNAIWARNVSSSNVVIFSGLAIDKDTTTNVLLGLTGGTLDNTGTSASSITLSTGANFYLAPINSKGQWSSRTLIGSNGANNIIDGIYTSGGIAIDTLTKELRVGVNLGYLNFKAAYFDLNSKAPLNAAKFDAFVVKIGCVNAGIYSQPKDSLACPNGTIYGAVQAIGSNFIYSWKKNNVTIGTNSAIYSKGAAAFADSGSYRVDIKSVCFKDTTSISSNVVKLGVKTAPVIIAQPKGDTVCIGKFIKIGVKVKGYGLKYSWMYTGCQNCIVGTEDTMSTTIASKYSASNYYSIVTDACNRTVTSAYAPIVVESPITAYAITAGATTCEQGLFKLTSSATSTGNSDPNYNYTPKLKYTWLKDNVIIPNSNLNFLEKANVAQSDSGNYTLQVSNTGCKTPVTTAAVKVKINVVSPFNSASNLKFYMPLNGTFADESGVSNFTTTSTATFTADRNAITSAAANFATANTTNQIRVKDSLFSKSTIGTLSFWFKTSATSQVLFGMQDKALNASPNQSFVNGYIDNGGYFRGALYTGSTFLNTAIKNNYSKLPVNDNKWHNLVITYNTNTQTIYIDGLPQYTIAGTILTKSTNTLYTFTVAQFGSTIGTGNNIYTGINAGTSFVGQLDDISVHGTAYDACDVARLYSLGVQTTPVGIEENTSNSNYSIAPNPFENELTLNSETAFGKVSISDITGKIVFETEKTESVLKINTTQLQSGIYFVKLGNEVIKVVK